MSSLLCTGEIPAAAIGGSLTGVSLILTVLTVLVVVYWKKRKRHILPRVAQMPSVSLDSIGHKATTVQVTKVVVDCQSR